jgi:hypothetical protein
LVAVDELLPSLTRFNVAAVIELAPTRLDKGNFKNPVVVPLATLIFPSVLVVPLVYPVL